MFNKPYIIDCHCDTLLRVIDKDDSMYVNTSNHLDFQSLKNNSVIAQFFAAWVDSKKFKGRCFQRAVSMIDKLYREVDKHSTEISVAKSYQDILNNIEAGVVSALISVEGGDAIEGEISLLRTLHRLGVRSLTLTWNGRNEIADGVSEKDSRGGLTTFGKSVIRECNELGIIIDVSHISEAGFWDVISVTNSPIIASHSNSFDLCNHPRNLKLEQIKAIAQNRGTIGINFAAEFLDTKTNGIDYIIRHIDYISDIVGVDYLSMGSDFDGITAPNDITGPSCYNDIINSLLKRNYRESDIKKIMGENILRVIKEVVK